MSNCANIMQSKNNDPTFGSSKSSHRGLRKKRIPSEAPGNVTPRISKAVIIM